MSWQDYVNAYLINSFDAQGRTASNVCEHGAIVGYQDGTVWASSPGFSLGKYQTEGENEDGTTSKFTIDEFANLKDSFERQGQVVAKGGIKINGEKYYGVSFNADMNIWYLKKSGGGAAVAKSNLGFVIGIFSQAKKLVNFHGKQESQSPGSCNVAVENLQKFLLENSL